MTTGGNVNPEVDILLTAKDRTSDIFRRAGRGVSKYIGQLENLETAYSLVNKRMKTMRLLLLGTLTVAILARFVKYTAGAMEMARSTNTARVQLRLAGLTASEVSAKFDTLRGAVSRASYQGILAMGDGLKQFIKLSPDTIAEIGEMAEGMSKLTHIPIDQWADEITKLFMLGKLDEIKKIRQEISDNMVPALEKYNTEVEKLGTLFRPEKEAIGSGVLSAFTVPIATMRKTLENFQEDSVWVTAGAIGGVYMGNSMADGVDKSLRTKFTAGGEGGKLGKFIGATIGSGSSKGFMRVFGAVFGAGAASSGEELYGVTQGEGDIKTSIQNAMSATALIGAALALGERLGGKVGGGIGANVGLLLVPGLIEILGGSKDNEQLQVQSALLGGAIGLKMKGDYTGGLTGVLVGMSFADILKEVSEGKTELARYKVIGATIGFAIGGPMGAAIGASMGDVIQELDNKLKELLRKLPGGDALVDKGIPSIVGDAIADAAASVGIKPRQPLSEAARQYSFGDFQHGGIVPGPVGKPVPVTAHGGEMFLGTGGLTLNLWLDRNIIGKAALDALKKEMRTTGGINHGSVRSPA